MLCKCVAIIDGGGPVAVASGSGKGPAAAGGGEAPILNMDVKGTGNILFIVAEVSSNRLMVIDDDGQVDVHGPDANWTVNHLKIGEKARGTLNLSGKANLTTQVADLGVEKAGLLPGSGGIGNAFVSGIDTFWDAGKFTIGDLGAGGLTILGGARVVSREIIAGGLTTG